MFLRIFLWIFIIISLIFLLKWFERKNIYFPARKLINTPDDIGLDYEDVYLATEDSCKIHGWFIPAKSKKYLLFCHGNAGNISHRLESINIFHSLNLNIFIFDYRGFGKSKGIATERGTYLDAKASYNYLIDKGLESESIIIFGRSLGANIAIHLASIVNKGILITEGGFTSTMDMARSIYGIRITEKVLSFKYNALEQIKNVSIPKLIIHSEHDEMIPFKHAKRLFSAASEPKELFILSGTHNVAFIEHREEYRQRVSEFIDKWMGK